MSDEAMDTGAALMELAAGRRNPIKKSSRRFDQADLGAYLLAMIHGLFTDPAQLNKSEGGKLIIIEQFMDDPELTDLLLAAMRGKREFLDIMNVFSLVFEPPSPNRDKVDAREMPAVFNFIPWRHELPNDRESTERRMHEMTIVLKAVASAMLTGKNVIVMVKRQGHVAREFRVMETVVLAITPMDAASLALVCNALYKPALSLAFPEDEVWPLLVTYSDLLAQAKVEDEQIVEVLRQCASERLMSLQGGDAATDLAAFKGRNHLKQWVNDVRHTLAEPNPAARLQMFSVIGRGALLQSSQDEFGSMVAQSVANALQLRFIRMSGEEFLERPLAILDQADDYAPCLLHITPGAWQQSAISTTPGATAEVAEYHANRFSALLRELRATFDPRFPLIITTSAPDFTEVCADLMVPDCFTRLFEIGALDDDHVGSLILRQIGEQYCSAQLIKSVSKVGKLFPRPFMPAQAVYFLRRRAMNGRKLTFADLVDITHRGMLEADDSSLEESKAQRVATAHHEAGHAAMTMITSVGADIPDYASIVPVKTAHGSIQGVVVKEIGGSLYARGPTGSYAGFRNLIRVSLAGRAAEELFGSTDRIGAGASSDLQNATILATEAFAQYGYAPGMDTNPDLSGSNLAVCGMGPIGLQEDVTLQRVRLAEMVRSFLEKEYRETLRLLEANKKLVKAIATQLMKEPILDRVDMAKLLRLNPIAKPGSKSANSN